MDSVPKMLAAIACTAIATIGITVCLVEYCLMTQSIYESTLQQEAIHAGLVQEIDRETGIAIWVKQENAQCSGSH